MILPAQNPPDLQSLEGGNGLGTLLRTARQEAGVSLDQLSQTTRITSRILKSLENGTFESLPAPVFVRGYLKSISKELNTELAPLLSAFEAASAEAPKGPTRKVHAIAPSKPNVSFKTGHVLAVLLAILGFFLIYFAVEGSSSNTSDPSMTDGRSTVVTPDTRPIHPR
jgi:cytoskeleton protein RodZ